MNWRIRIGLAILCALGIAAACAAKAWMGNVPEADRMRANPYAGQKEAIAGGSRLFAENCAQCHGSDALGGRGRPSLRTKEVQQATDGELLWLLRNGNRFRGMPSWNSLPEPSRWQIVAFIKSLGVSGAPEPPSREKKRKCAAELSIQETERK